MERDADDRPMAPHLPAVVDADHTRFAIPSRPDWIEKTVEYLGQRARMAGVCDEQRIQRLELALHEAVTNSVVHGNLEISSDLKERDDDSFAQELAKKSANPKFSSRLVEIVVDYDGTRCQWMLTDQGRGFDYQKVLKRLAPDDPESEVAIEAMLASGRGILMMQSLMDEVRYGKEGRQLTLAIEKPTGGEKRLNLRMPLTSPVRVIPMREDGSVDWQSAYHAVSRDLSENGIGLLQSHLGQAKRLMIELPSGSAANYVVAEICRVDTLPDGVVELGCRFEPSTLAAQTSAQAQPQPDDLTTIHAAIGDILDNLDTPDVEHDERRQHTRAVYYERIKVRTDAESEPRSAYARDLSKGGIAFITTYPLPLDRVLLSLPDARGADLHLQAQIRRCDTLTEGFYDVGAKFVGWSS